MEDQITVTLTARGLKNPESAVRAVTALFMRSMYLVDGEPGEFCVEITSVKPGAAGPERTVLADGGRWRRERDSNSRGTEPNGVSSAAP